MHEKLTTINFHRCYKIYRHEYLTWHHPSSLIRYCLAMLPVASVKFESDCDCLRVKSCKSSQYKRSEKRWLLKSYFFQIHICVNLRQRKYVLESDQKKIKFCKFKWFPSIGSTFSWKWPSFDLRLCELGWLSKLKRFTLSVTIIIIVVAVVSIVFRQELYSCSFLFMPTDQMIGWWGGGAYWFWSVCLSQGLSQN